MSLPIANARMYSASASVKEDWKTLLGWILRYAGLEWPVIDYDPPAPLSTLWARDDLGLVLMCGLPFAHDRKRVRPIAAPLPSTARYAGRAVYCTDIVVRADSSARNLSDTFGGTIGYTVPDSLSGAIALARHLAPIRAVSGRPLYRDAVGGLIHARGVIQALIDRRIDVGPLDSYYHDLLRAADPRFAEQVRTIASTETRPLPLFVSTLPLETANVERLREAFRASARAIELAPVRQSLCLGGFAFPEAHEYDSMLDLPRHLDDPNEAF